jgi:Flp pilus assembly pilin Flp
MQGHGCAIGFNPRIAIALALLTTRSVSIGTNVLPGQRRKGATVIKIIQQLWGEEQGQDVAEYAVMLAVILVIVIGTVRLIGGNANNVFSQVSSQMTQ